jgi:hypothetical protein
VKIVEGQKLKLSGFTRFEEQFKKSNMCDAHYMLHILPHASGNPLTPKVLRDCR